MPDTVASSLWLSLVDMLVVFAVLAFLMVVCYGLKYFSRGSVMQGSTDDGDSQVDVATGNEPASEHPMIQSVSETGQNTERLSAVPTTVNSGHPGTDGGFAFVQADGDLRTPTPQSRAFRITVNGKTFEVGVEQMAGAQPVVQSVSQVAATPAPISQRPVAVPPSLPATSHPVPSAHTSVTPNLMKSPLPGKILKVFATPGKAFKRGDTLLVIEAMKMENEILAPRDCVIGGVHVAVNQLVKTGESLLRLE